MKTPIGRSPFYQGIPSIPATTDPAAIEGLIEMARDDMQRSAQHNEVYLDRIRVRIADLHSDAEYAIDGGKDTALNALRDISIALQSIERDMR